MDVEGTPLRMETAIIRTNPETTTTRRRTYSLRGLNMLNQHNQLLLRKEALKTRIILIIWISLQNHRSSTMPVDILSFGEQILHQLILAGKLNIDMALAQTTSSTTGTISLEAVDSVDGLIKVDEFNVTV